MLAQLSTYILAISSVEAQSWNIRKVGSTYDNVQAVAVDQLDNVYVIALSPDNQIYDASGSLITLSFPSNQDFSYLLKFASNGSFLWAAGQRGGGTPDCAYALVADSLGDVIQVGYFYTPTLTIYDSQSQNVSILFNANAGGGFVAIFIVKYTSSGQFLWISRMDGTKDDYAYGVTVDQSNNIIFTGSYVSSPLIIYNILGATVKSLPNAGASASYVARYLSNGSFLWAARQDGTGSDEGHSVSLDSVGNIFIVGYYFNTPLVIRDSLDRIVSNAPNVGFQTAFIIKYMSNGSFLWVTRQDGTANDYLQSVGVDFIGNVYAAGYYFSNPLTIFDSLGKSVASLTLSGTGTFGALLVKYLNNGTFAWALRVDGTGDDVGNAVTVDNQGNAIITGSYTSSPLPLYDSRGLVVAQLSNSGSTDAFTAKYLFNGSLLWTSRQGGTLDDYGDFVTTDSACNVFSGGRYYSSPLFIYDSFGKMVTSLANFGYTDGYLVKYSSNGTYLTQSVTSTAASQQQSSPVTLSSSTVPSSTSVKLSSSQSSSITSVAVSVTLGALSSVDALFQTSSSQSLGQSATQMGNLLILPQFDFSVIGHSTSNSVETLLDIRDVSQKFQSSYFTYVVISGAILLVMLCAGLVFTYIRHRRRVKRMLVMPNRTTVMSTLQTTYSSTSTDMTSTVQVTSHVLAVPKFMVLLFGLHFRSGGQIARGGGGSIHFCQVLDPSKIPGYDGSQLVLKNLGKDSEQLSQNIRVAFYQEIAMLYLFRDQTQFAKLYGFSEEPATIILKYYELGSLKEFILTLNKKSSRFRYSKRQFFILTVQLCQGLAFMHQKQFVHNDVKPDNVLLEDQDGLLQPRITDFGISRLLDASLSQVKEFKLSVIKGASIAYASPDAIHRFRNGYVEGDAEVWKSGDVFSLSIVFLEMMLRKRVWNGR